MSSSLQSGAVRLQDAALAPSGAHGQSTAGTRRPKAPKRGIPVDDPVDSYGDLRGPRGRSFSSGISKSRILQGLGIRFESLSLPEFPAESLVFSSNRKHTQFAHASSGVPSRTSNWSPHSASRRREGIVCAPQVSLLRKVEAAEAGTGSTSPSGRRSRRTLDTFPGAFRAAHSPIPAPHELAPAPYMVDQMAGR